MVISKGVPGKAKWEPVAGILSCVLIELSSGCERGVTLSDAWAVTPSSCFLIIGDTAHHSLCREQVAHTGLSRSVVSAADVRKQAETEREEQGPLHRLPRSGEGQE